ncbi:unnamed protein product, partial [Closterium sp. Naga37s-1]
WRASSAVPLPPQCKSSGESYVAACWSRVEAPWSATFLSGSQLPYNLRLFLTPLSAGSFVVLVALDFPRASLQARV